VTNASSATGREQAAVLRIPRGAADPFVVHKDGVRGFVFGVATGGLTEVR